MPLSKMDNSHKGQTSSHFPKSHFLRRLSFQQGSSHCGSIQGCDLKPRFDRYRSVEKYVLGQRYGGYGIHGREGHSFRSERDYASRFSRLRFRKVCQRHEIPVIVSEWQERQSSCSGKYPPQQYPPKTIVPARISWWSSGAELVTFACWTARLSGCPLCRNVCDGWWYRIPTSASTQFRALFDWNTDFFTVWHAHLGCSRSSSTTNPPPCTPAMHAQRLFNVSSRGSVISNAENQPYLHVW